MSGQVLLILLWCSVSLGLERVLSGEELLIKSIPFLFLLLSCLIESLDNLEGILFLKLAGLLNMEA